MGCRSVSAGLEVTVDKRVSGEEILGLPGRFESLHLPLSSSRRSMRVLGPIIQISALSMLDARQQPALSDAIAPQLVGDDHPRLIVQALQQPSEEAHCGTGVAPGLNQDIEHNAMLIDGAPKVVLHALDPDEDFIQVPLVAWLRPPASQPIRETRGEFLAPAAHRLVGDQDATLSEDQLNIRRLRLNTWYNQTAWLMISAGNRWR
jgi:hypothetical protein